jgi:hypothetical protein
VVTLRGRVWSSNESTYEIHIFYILPWNAPFTVGWLPTSFMYSGFVNFPNWPHGCKDKFVVVYDPCDHKPCLPISLQFSNVEGQSDFHSLCYCWFGLQHWKIECWMDVFVWSNMHILYWLINRSDKYVNVGWLNAVWCVVEESASLLNLNRNSSFRNVTYPPSKVHHRSASDVWHWRRRISKVWLAGWIRPPTAASPAHPPPPRSVWQFCL